MTVPAAMAVVIAVWGLCGCRTAAETDAGGPGDASDAADSGWVADATPDSSVTIGRDLTRDVVSADLTFDLAAFRGSAAMAVAPSASEAVTLDVSGITVDAVTDEMGAPLPFRTLGAFLDIAVPSTDLATAPLVVNVDYGFTQWPNMLPTSGGWMTTGSTMLWPEYCGRLYPCHPDTNDGLTFSMSITGAPAGMTAVYPASIPSDAPAYQIAFAVGPLTYEELGLTTAGTTVAIWWWAGERSSALAGTASLVDYFDWYETTLGSYTFGGVVGAVAVDWGGAFSGGFEHHPIWHVSRDAMDSTSVHAHEVAHGWFGGGVRLRCWEDLVMSEGTAEYLMARVLAAVDGQDLWPQLQMALDFFVAVDDRVAWPTGCNVTDPFDLLNAIPYYKGAFFYRNVELQTGAAALDSALATFYVTYRNQAAGMQDLLDTILAVTGFDPTTLADGWLRSLGTP